MLLVLNCRRLNIHQSKSFTSSVSLLFSHFFTSSTVAVPFTADQNPIETLSKPQLKTLVLNLYKNGKFTNLFHNIVATPPVLLTACQNLVAPPHSTRDNVNPNSSDSPCPVPLSSISARFNLEELATLLASNEFDPASCCVTLQPPSSSIHRQGESLVLPNLKLKVVIEAIRMVLEALYGDGFRTFVYGGRAGMGRHTAIRYLKNSIENPSWWFTVAFNRVSSFDSRHVDILCSIIAERIDDDLLIGLIRRLFELEVVRIELGACYLGRGLPQESGLSSILLNVYLNGFDKKLQQIRLRVNEEGNKVVGDGGCVFHRPVRISAVRYLDEVLVITSGSKVQTLDLKNWVLKYLEEKLELKVDKVRTAVHSAVSEKIGFLGMELQAVPPSVLRPPMSEMAVRAMKKHIRQKEVRALEMRNARERNRRMLGMKILKHVHKKAKQSPDGFKFEYEIEEEVKDVFMTWGDEVVRDFLGSVDERWNWHRHLTAGNFLKLQRIRNLLPEELVDAYDKFQGEVNKYLSPVKVRKVMEAEEQRVEEEEERRYSERTVADLTKHCVKVDVPEELVKKAVRLAGFTNKMGRPRPIESLFALEDSDIIKWYAGVGSRWLDYFCCCHNFRMMKTVVSYHMRFSCLLTLKDKHVSTKREAMRHYTKDLKVMDYDGKEEVCFPTEMEVKRMGNKNLSDPKPVDGVLGMVLVRLAYDEDLYECRAHFCDRKDTVVYRVKLLQDELGVNPRDVGKWVAGMGWVHQALSRKCLPLCCDHVSQLYMGRISLRDIDCSAFVNVD